MGTNNAIPFDLVRRPPTKKFTPVGNRVALHVYQHHETPGGLALPDSASGSWESVRALVIAVGPDVTQVKEGDLVLTAGNTHCQKVRYKGDEYIVLPENQITGVVIRGEEEEVV